MYPHSFKIALMLAIVLQVATACVVMLSRDNYAVVIARASYTAMCSVVAYMLGVLCAPWFMEAHVPQDECSQV